MLKKILFFIIVIFGLCFIQAQEPISIHITEKDGLPDIEFYSILEDSKGFIWLASESGLYRYDGKSYIQYSNDEKRGLSVFDLSEDEQGRVWCTNISGQFFYIENNKLITFIDLKDELKGQLGKFQVQGKDLIITTIGASYFIDLATKKIRKKKLSYKHGLHLIRDNDIYVSIDFDSIKVLSNDYKVINHFPLDSNYYSDNLKIRGKTHFFKLNEIFFFSQQLDYKNRFTSVNISTGEIRLSKGLEAIEATRIISIKIIGSQLWVLTYKGAYIYEYVNSEFILKNKILKTEKITDVIIDKDQNYWVSTLANGIYLIPNIEVLKHHLPESSNDVMAINKVNDSTVFFGSKKGEVGLLNINTSAYKLSTDLRSKVSAIQYNHDKKSSYVSTDISSYIVDNATLKATKTKGFQGIKSYSRLNNNEILFGTYINLMLLDEKTGLLKKYSNTKRVYTTYFNAKEDMIYVGYVDNLIALDHNLKSTIIKYNNKEIFARSITQTKDGRVWIGTFKNGIFVLKNNKIIQRYLKEDGLLSNQIKYIKADGNNIWIATPKGLQELNSKTKTFKNLTKTEGILSYKISGIEILNNRVVVASNKGVFSFEKDKVFKERSCPEIYFSEIKINEKSVALDTSYHLDYNQNSIQFSFNVNGILYNKNRTYQYRLLGYNEDWITTDLDINTIKYSSLPAGQYTFQVRPTTINETSLNEVKSVSLIIKLPFWKKWWFILGYSLTFIGLIIFYYKRKLKNKEKAREIEIKQLSLDKQLIALKLENLRSQMNPHFIFNALNSIQEYIILNQRKLASEYLGKFADLIRTYLNHSTKGKITLQEEIDCLEMYLELEKLRFEDKLDYKIITSGNLYPKEINIPTMLVQPYVENALKHGLLHRKTDRILSINFFIDEISNVVKCTIVDNGVGRVKAEEFKARSRKTYQSFATKATSDRLTLLNYGKQKQIGVTITDLMDGENAAGTQVEIIIPYTTH